MLFGDVFLGYDRIYNHQCKMVLLQELGIPKMGNHENHWGFWGIAGIANFNTLPNEVSRHTQLPFF